MEADKVAGPDGSELSEGLGPDEWTQAKLARMTLWLAYCWNDHNFDKRPDQYARECAKELGIAGFEDANDWLAGVKVENPRRTLPALPAARVLASGKISGKHVELKGWHEDDLKAWAEKNGFVFGA